MYEILLQTTTLPPVLFPSAPHSILLFLTLSSSPLSSFSYYSLLYTCVYLCVSVFLSHFLSLSLSHPFCPSLKLRTSDSGKTTVQTFVECQFGWKMEKLSLRILHARSRGKGNSELVTAEATKEGEGVRDLGEEINERRRCTRIQVRRKGK